MIPPSIKQEEAERKRAEEKARRDAIFQNYMLRKTEQDDDETRSPVAVVMRRQKNNSATRGGGATARPKSHLSVAWEGKESSPPPMMTMLGASGGDMRGSVGRKGSQEDVVARGERSSVVMSSKSEFYLYNYY